MISKPIIVVLFLLLCGSALQAQKISIDVVDMPLDRVLIQVRDVHGVSVSFDNSSLKKYSITLKKDFQTVGEAMDYLLKSLPLSYVVNNDVYIVFTDDKKIPPTPALRKRTIRGKVFDAKTHESLPFTTIAINGKGTITDGNGYFFYQSYDSVFRMTFSQIGYFTKDTTLASDVYHRVKLVEAINEIDEIVVTDKLIETFVYIEKTAGVIRLNHSISRFLPGSSDNSVFNLLRLQTGIVASAEASDNLLIWGAYEGQSRILLDGFLLFGLKNFNDNISAVNPLIVKDIKVFKAAFNADYGKCVGGIADIRANDGNKLKPGFQFALNNYTLNGSIETPINKNASLLTAFRHTFHNLYDVTQMDLLEQRKLTLNDVVVVPDYVFRDFNLKYHFNGNAGTYSSFSFLIGQDIFSYQIDEDVTDRLSVKIRTAEENRQRGASFLLGHNFDNGFEMSVNVTGSDLKTVFNKYQTAFLDVGSGITRQNDVESINTTSETAVSWDNKWSVASGHSVLAQLMVTRNTSFWNEDTSGVAFIDQNMKGNYFTFSLLDQITTSHVNVKPGMRFTYAPFVHQWLFEPRLSIEIPMGQLFNVSFAGGLYNQLLNKNSVEDEDGNFRYMWSLANDSVYPVVESEHATAAIHFNERNTQISLASYVRQTNGLTRYVNYPKQQIEGVSKGKSTSYGVDFYIKQNFRKHTAWISYTFSETKELFEHFIDQKYRYAPQDQRHEIKLATIFDFDPVFFSANYVYGSGFPIYEINGTSYEITRTPYIRLDLAMIYKFRWKKIIGETGISVLNVFDRENILYNNLERVPANQSNTIRIYEESVPFTPSIHLKIVY